MMTLRQIRDRWNELVTIAATRGIHVDRWSAVPASRDYGLHRLNGLLRQLGMPPISDTVEVVESAGARMSLRQIQATWNSLVPQAQERGVRVSIWNGVPTNSRDGLRRLAWLRAQLHSSTSSQTPTEITVSGYDAFANETFGIELEVLMPVGMTHAMLALHLDQNGVVCRNETYNHNTVPHWKIVTDGSLRNYERGAEVVSPVLRGADGFQQCRKVCEILTARRVKVTKKCGYHIHVGAANRPVKFFTNMLRMYDAFGPVIDSMMAPSRRGNSCPYAFGTQYRAAFENARSVQALIMQAQGGGRYRKLNLASYNRHKTIEFRQHQGTFDADKVEMWARVCMRMAMRADTDLPQLLVPFEGVTFDSFAKLIKLDEEETAFFRERIEWFARDDARLARLDQRRRERRGVLETMRMGGN